ncbi:uncharacterized protein [Miscanthus floridulus]|uniref:uncharacterized protein n=1 Tax=Miscanthus floridulus TaxID=154761 RepID=UPI00345888AF
MREELDKRRRQQRKDGLLFEESPSSSQSMEASNGDDEGKVAEAQAALHRGAASARADLKEPATQGGAAEAALTEEGEAAPPPRDGKAHGSDAAEVPLAIETTRTEVPRVLSAAATETAAPGTIEAATAGTGALATTEATMAEARAPETAEASMVEAGAPGTTEATMAEARAPGTTDADAIVAGLPAQEMEMKAAKALAAPLVQGPPPLRESAREVEILLISSDDTSWTQEMAGAEAAGVMEQPVPTPGEGSSALAQLGSEASRAAEASQVEAQRLKERAEASRAKALCWKEKAEACQVETRCWEQKAKESEAKVTRAAEASSAVQTVLKTEIREHEELKSAARATCDALAVEGVQSGSSLGSHLIALSGQVREQLRGALHAGVKHALAIIASHYVGVDLQAISDGYVLPDDDDEADEVVTKLLEAAEGPSTALATLFEEEVVPPPPSADAGGAEP